MGTRTKIIILFGVLIAVIIINAAVSIYHESRGISRRIEATLRNKFDIADSIQNNELDQLGMISVSIKEQSSRFGDFLDYDNIAPITMILKNITNIYPDDIDFIFLFDEDGELLTSNTDGTEIEEPGHYNPLIEDRRERVGIEEISPKIFEGALARFKPAPDHERIICFKSLLHILHDSGDIYCYMAVIKLINNNRKLIRKMAEIAGADAVYYGADRKPLLSSFSDLTQAYPVKHEISYQNKLFFTEEKELFNYAGKPVGRLVIALDKAPFLESERQLLLSRLMPFFASTLISVVLFFLLKIRIFDKVTQLIEVQRMVAEGKGDLSVRVKIPHEKTGTALDEMERMGSDFNMMMDKLEQTHGRLTSALADVREANRYIIQSLQYAGRIQSSMLPNPEAVKCLLPDSFVIWMPRDIVSGDIFFIEPVDEGLMIIAVIDCTGHGVPGAFLTMIASSALSRIISDEKCRDPALILNRLNLIVKATLHQDTAYAVSDDGMDAALCIINMKEKILTFAGARLPLFYFQNSQIQVVKGDRQSIGYKQSKRSDIAFDFTNHHIQIEKGMSFYMATDGFEDQLGSSEQSQFALSRLGRKRFSKLLGDISHLNFETREAKLVEAFEAHKGDNDRQDDVTVVGFGVF